MGKRGNRVVPGTTAFEEEKISLLGGANARNLSSLELKRNDVKLVEKVSSLSVLNPMIDTSLLCVFIVRFDLKIGYQVEYQIQNNGMTPIDMNGIEYKCLPSGSHKLDTDTVLFRHVYEGKECFGLACVDIYRSEELDRGSRIRALGVIAKDYKGIMTHADFLKTSINTMNKYDNTEEGSHHFKTYLHKIGEYFSNYDSATRTQEKRLSEITKDEIDKHLNFGSLISMFYHYRENIFVLWKALLLKKRILISAPVPIENACSKVHAMHFLTYFAPQQGSKHIESHFGKDIVYSYYLSLNEYAQVARMNHFVACTCDEIYETKTECFDVLIKDKNVIIHDKDLKTILKKSSSDDEKSKLLDTLLGSISYMARSEQELIFRKYFALLNNQTIYFLTDHDGGEAVTTTTIQKAKDDGTLHLCGDDIDFIKELSQLIGLDIEFSTSSFCCC